MRALIVAAFWLLLVAIPGAAQELVSAPPEPGAAVAVSEADALRLENLSLKLANHDVEVWRIRRQVEDSQRALAAERERLDAAFRAAYGVGLDEVERRGAGFVVRGEKP